MTLCVVGVDRRGGRAAANERPRAAVVRRRANERHLRRGRAAEPVVGRAADARTGAPRVSGGRLSLCAAGGQWRRGGVVATPWDVAPGGRRLRDAVAAGLPARAAVRRPRARAALRHRGARAAPLPAFGTCLLLLGSELVLSTFVLGTLCPAPPPPGSPSAGLNLTGCAGTLLCLPFAGLLSPMIGLWSFVSSALDARAAAAAGRERALGGVVGKAGRAAAAADGAVIVRRLHASAVWNCASLPTPSSRSSRSRGCPTISSSLVAVAAAVALLVAKLLLAQALKEVAPRAASTGGRGRR